MKGAYKVIN